MNKNDWIAYEVMAYLKDVSPILLVSCSVRNPPHLWVALGISHERCGMQTGSLWNSVGTAGVLCKLHAASAVSSLIMNNDAWGLFCLFAGLEMGSGLFLCERLIRGRYELIMVGRCTGLHQANRASEVFVCTSWFLRLNGCRVLPAALDQNSQPEQGQEPPPTHTH